MARNKKSNYLIKNTLLLILSSFGSKILSFLLVPLYTNILSTAEYGIADLITTTAALLMYIFTLNIETSVLRFGLDENEKKDRVLAYAVQIVVIGTCIVSVVTFFVSLFRIFEWPNYCYPILVIVFFLDSIHTIITNYLRAIDKVKHMAFGGVLETVGRLTTNIIVLVYLKWGLFGFLISLIVGPVLRIVYSVYFILPLRKSKIDRVYEKRLHKEMRLFSIPTIFSQLAWWINNSLDRYFIICLKGYALNGVYAVSYKIPNIMAILCNIFGQAWGISAIKEFDKDDSDGFFSNTYRLFNTSLVVACSFLILINIPVSKLLYAKEFFEAWKYASLLIVAMMFSGLSSFFSGIFFSVKKNTIFALTTVIAAIINTVLNALLIPQFGAMGAAVATVVSFYSAWLSRVIASKKYVNIKISIIRDHIVYLLLILQIIFEHFENHFYFGQIVIVLIVCIFNYKDIRKVLCKGIQAINNRLGIKRKEEE